MFFGLPMQKWGFEVLLAFEWEVAMRRLPKHVVLIFVKGQDFFLWHK
jgi:nitrogen fixation protein